MTFLQLQLDEMIKGSPNPETLRALVRDTVKEARREEREALAKIVEASYGLTLTQIANGIRQRGRQ